MPPSSYRPDPIERLRRRPHAISRLFAPLTPRGRRRTANAPARRLFIEPLEDRTLLAGSITGTVVNDLNGNGQRDAGEPGVPGATVYLDLNGNGRYDAPTTVPGSTNIHDLGGVQGVTANVSGVSAQYSHVTVSLTISRSASATGVQPDVFLASPQGFNDGNGPELTPLPAGVSIGDIIHPATFDDNATTSILSASPPFTGTYQPAQLFGSPSNNPFEVYNVNPNGTWFLLLLDHDGKPVKSDGITITSWSLTFTQEPATQTAADGSYSFTGLAPGSYAVGVSGTQAAHDPLRTVSVGNGQAVADIAVKPTPGSVSGTLTNSQTGQGVPHATVYLDRNGNGKYDPPVTFSGSTAIHDLGGLFGVIGTVSGVSPQYNHVTVSLSITRAAGATGATPEVFLASPQGFNDGNGPELTPLPAGVSISATFDDGAATPITSASPPFAGTYQPVQLFGKPGVSPFEVYDVNPNGTWFLLLLDHNGNPVADTGISIGAWSITFTQEPATQTDANGHYTVSGLAPGNYTVGVSGAVVGPDPTRTVGVLTGQTTTANFALKPAADLVATSFQVAGGFATGGQTVTVNYTLANRGFADAGAFDVELRLSNDSPIDGTDSLLQTIHVDALAAGAITTGKVTVTLPGSVVGPPEPIYLGLIVDPANAVTELSQTDKSNQGLGIDTALLSNAALTTDAGVQQQPSIVVDPHDPNHLVVAYMDYRPVTAAGAPAVGYAGISVRSSTDGGLTWTTTPVLPAGFAEAAGYPSVAFDDQGHVYVSFMAATFKGPQPPVIFPDGRDSSGTLFRSYGMQASNGIFLSYSNDGGLTWADHPLTVVSHTYTPGGTPVPYETIPDLAIDRSAVLPNGQPNPNYGHIYVTWTRYYPAGQMPGVSPQNGGSDAMIAYSADGGASWTTPGKTIFSGSIAAGGNSVVKGITLTPGNIVTASLFPAANAVGGFVMQVFALNPSTGHYGLVAAVPTNGTQPITFRVPVSNNTIAIRIIGADATSQGGFTWEVAPTNDVPALRELTADGSSPPGGGFDDFSHVTVGPEGNVYVSLFRGGAFRVFSSADGGTTFLPAGLPFGGSLSTLPTSMPLGGDIRTFPVRQIVADPTRPGTVYALEAVQVSNPNFTPNVIDGAQVEFSRSTDAGQTWSPVFTLNDDDGGRDLGLATSLVNEVISGQAMPVMSVDNHGNIAVIWYDTRRDPANHNFDVFGVSSSDGGQTFGANYRVSDATFNPDVGGFPAGGNDVFLGDHIGLAAVNDTALAVWTDTRNGNQDVFFARYPLSPAPAPPTERFDPNNLPQIATDLGSISVPRVLPRLALTPGDEDWFRLTAAASGDLIISATGSGGVAPQTVELFDTDGTTLLATAVPIFANGQVVERQIDFAGQSGHVYLVHVAGVPSGVTNLGYSLGLESLTADLGTLVHTTRHDTLSAGGVAVYRAAAAVAGSMEVTLTADAGAGALVLQVLSADGLSVVQMGTAGAPGVQSVSIPVSAGQTVLLSVRGQTATDAGGYTLELSNLDQFETAQNATLFFPTSGTPTALGAADMNGDGHLDLVTASANFNNPVNVLLNNGDGTFGASLGFDAGPGAPAGLRDLVLGDFTGSSHTGVAVSNYQSADVSVLPGNGDGTLQPPRRSDTTTTPDAMASGHFDGGANLDLAVLQRQAGADGFSHVAVLLGRGDGTFLPPLLLTTTFPGDAGTIVVGDFSGHAARGDHLDDIAVFGFNKAKINVFVNQGNGAFILKEMDAPEAVASALAADLNGDGNLDLILGGTNNGDVYVLLGNGDGTFQAPQTYFANTDPARTAASVSGLALADLGSPTELGTPDTHTDLIVTVIPRPGNGSPQVVMLPGLVDGGGHFAGFDSADRKVLALGPFTGPVVAADLAKNGVLDVAAAVPGGVEVIYGKRPTIAPNTTQAAARDLGTVVHWVSPTQTIVPGHTDAWFTMTVPKEAVPGAGPEVIDFSALFQFTDGNKLGFEVIGPNGPISGQRFQMVANPGDVLTLHVFGQPGGDDGAYTLAIDVLPQAVSVAAPALVPGGPVSSLVVTLQGDRLDPTTAEVPQNYTLIFLGADGQTQSFTPATINDGKPVIYDPGANIDVATGLTFPTAVRQTVTLFFPAPLPAGSYLLRLSQGIQTAPYSDAEAGLLVPGDGFTDHTVASDGNPGVENGALLYLPDLVPQPTASGGDFTRFAGGTAFLTAFHDNLGAALDAAVTNLGDSSGITPALLDQSEAAFDPGRTTATETPSFLVLFLDPVSLSVADSQNRRAVFDLRTNQVTNTQPKTYVEVGGNIEVVVVADVAGAFRLNVSDVNATARGGALVIGPQGVQQFSLTDALRAGVQQFVFDVPASLTVGPLGPTVTEPTVPATTGGATATVAASLEVAQATPTTTATIDFTQAPVNEAGAAGAGAGGPAVAAGGAPLSGGGGSAAVSAKGIDDFFQDGIDQVKKVLDELRKRAGNGSTPVIGKGLEMLETLGVPAIVVPLRRVGEQFLRAVMRGVTGGLLGPGVQPPPPAAPGPDEVWLPPPADGPGPVLPPAEGRGDALWLAAALAGGLLPVWREAFSRERPASALPERSRDARG